MRKKLFPLKKFLSEKKKLKNKKVVFTNGCFDILHRGHVDYLDKAKKFGDILVVGLNSDKSVKRIKGGGRPINSESDRAFVLSGLESVDYIVIFNEDTPEKLITAIEPDVLVKGGDWKLKDIVGADFVKRRGGSVRRIRIVEGKSTTNVIDKIGKIFSK